MAKLNEGATSFAAANWSDATGFADNATLEIDKPFGPVTGGLDQSGLTTGIGSLDIRAGASGIIGGGGASLQVDTDTAGGDYIRNRGAVTLYLTGGGSGQINNLDLGGAQRTWLTGGTVTDLTMDGGQLNVGEAAVVTNAYLAGGSGEIGYNSTKMTLLKISGGSWVVRRGVTAMHISGGARVVYDPDDAVSHTSTAVYVNGGSLDWRAGAIPTVELKGGQISYAAARESFAPGATAFDVEGGEIYEGDGTVDTSNVAYPGVWSRGLSTLTFPPGGLG